MIQIFSLTILDTPPPPSSKCAQPLYIAHHHHHCRCFRALPAVSDITVFLDALGCLLSFSLAFSSFFLDMGIFSPKAPHYTCNIFLSSDCSPISTWPCSHAAGKAVWDWTLSVSEQLFQGCFSGLLPRCCCQIGMKKLWLLCTSGTFESDLSLLLLDYKQTHFSITYICSSCWKAKSSV